MGWYPVRSTDIWGDDMNTTKVYIVDLSSWGLVALAGTLGAYACYLYNAKVVTGLAHGIVSLFILQ